VRDSGLVRLLHPNMSAAERDFWKRTGYLTLGQQLNLDDSALDFLNAKFVFYPDLSTNDGLPSSRHWDLVYQGPDGSILQNQQVLPRQFLIPAGSTAPVPIDHLAASPDGDRLQVTGPAQLVWSKPLSQDWIVALDGRRAVTQPFDGYFLSISLPSGTHQVSISYQPAIYRIGTFLSVLSLAALALTAGLARFRRRQGSA
jgi:Bacterial membrane protein YfhO